MSRPHASLRMAGAVALAAVGALLGAAPAAAAGLPASPPPATPAPSAPSPAPASAAGPADALVPLVDCVQDAPLGAVSSRTVVLGYRSTAASPVTVPAASGTNDLTAGTADRGQPSTFAPGEHHGVWLLTLDSAAEPDLAWRLGATAVRFDGAPACTAATAVAVSAPERISAGDTVSVSAAVTRMLLAPPSTGAIAFALDGGPAVTAPVSTSGVARADLPVAAAGAHTVTATYLPADGSGLLPSGGSATVTATAPSAPLEVAVGSVVTGSSSVLVTVARASAEGTASADLMTADGTAAAGADYSPLATTVALDEGQTTATVRVDLPPRPAGSPAATFFVLLQRASTAVTRASATVRLPAVPAAVPAAGNGANRAGALPGASSALPPDDPTDGAPATASTAQDLAMLAGGILLTAGGILGVLGLVRAVGMREARA
ncbi:Calx-beta domain-containing protein [Leifsonia shinshuensis]|uniref:Calx-beta domain-containing protein n=1 Tax=Leifsonia shinshuensis TaxID=150026 RepID=UPI0028648DAA|nr:Calx-beta domain-containing protein [Leifsonia shinshuensis]MDR6971837.1 hypothetical protein [Leifsonia shinshuensis]